MLPLSHDEVVHGKSSILGRMSERMAKNCRLLYNICLRILGNLLFMGCEFGQSR
jgi:1,4-alpha-glucan branching enzyme